MLSNKSLHWHYRKCQQSTVKSQLDQWKKSLIPILHLILVLDEWVQIFYMPVCLRQCEKSVWWHKYLYSAFRQWVISQNGLKEMIRTIILFHLRFPPRTDLWGELGDDVMLLDKIITLKQSQSPNTHTHSSGMRGEKKYIIKSLRSAQTIQQSRRFQTEDYTAQYTCCALANRLINIELHKTVN